MKWGELKFLGLLLLVGLTLYLSAEVLAPSAYAFFLGCAISIAGWIGVVARDRGWIE